MIRLQLTVTDITNNNSHTNNKYLNEISEGVKTQTRISSNFTKILRYKRNIKARI